MALVTLWLAKEKVCGLVGVTRGDLLSVVIGKGIRNVCESVPSHWSALGSDRLQSYGAHLPVHVRCLREGPKRDAVVQRGCSPEERGQIK